MRIAHVVTFDSADGAFGGPTRVALSQATELAGRGHDVTVYAAAPLGEQGEFERDGYRLKLFPARRVLPFTGFAGIWPMGMRRALMREARSFDIAHIHMARDLVTLPAALVFVQRKVPYVVQTHGMIDSSHRLSARLLDALATRRALRRASERLVLTNQEREDLALLAPGRTSTLIGNGVAVGEIPAWEGREDTVLFLARLHERKRPLAFVAMARLLAQAMPTTTFRLIGPDEGQGELVSAAIADAGMGGRLEWVGPLPPSETSSALAGARAYVLPAVNEVFPMSILEAFAAGTPVVTTDSLGMVESCRKFGAAIITDGSPDALAAAVRAISSQDEIAQGLRGGASQFLQHELSIETVVNTVMACYDSALSRERAA